MEGLYAFVLQLTTFTFLMHTGLAIKCYVCNSRQDQRCLDPLNESENPLELTTCVMDSHQKMETQKQIEEVTKLLTKLGQISASDRKPSQIWGNDSYPMACQKMELEVIGEYVVGRGCSPVRIERYDPCEAVKLISKQDINVKSCSLCESDACNSGVKNHSLLFGIVAFILVLLMAT